MTVYRRLAQAFLQAVVACGFGLLSAAAASAQTGAATEHSHDALNRLTRTSIAGQGVIEHVYDSAGNLLRTRRASSSVLPGVWYGWNGTRYTREEVVETAEYFTKANSNWGPLRLRLPTPLNGDDFRIEFRAKNDPSLGGSYAYDLGFSLGNEFSSGIWDSNGNEVATRSATFTMTNGYFPDFFSATTDQGYSGWLYLQGALNTTAWHDYAFEAIDGNLKLYYDGALIYTQPYIGRIGPVDGFAIGGKSNLQLATGSFKVVR